MTRAGSPTLGLRENLAQFALLVAVNAFVGATTTFGDTRAAEAAAHNIHRTHGRVNGSYTDTAGMGHPYRPAIQSYCDGSTSHSPKHSSVHT